MSVGVPLDDGDLSICDRGGVMALMVGHLWWFFINFFDLGVRGCFVIVSALFLFFGLGFSLCAGCEQAPKGYRGIHYSQC